MIAGRKDLYKILYPFFCTKILEILFLKTDKIYRNFFFHWENRYTHTTIQYTYLLEREMVAVGCAREEEDLMRSGQRGLRHHKDSSSGHTSLMPAGPAHLHSPKGEKK